METAEGRVKELEKEFEQKNTTIEEQNEELVKLREAAAHVSLAEYERLRGPNIEELKTKSLLESKIHEEMYAMETKASEWQSRLAAEERARSALVMLFEKERRESLLKISQQEREKAELEERVFQMEDRVKSLLAFVMKTSGADISSGEGSFHPIQTVTENQNIASILATSPSEETGATGSQMPVQELSGWQRTKGMLPTEDTGVASSAYSHGPVQKLSGWRGTRGRLPAQ